MNHNQDDFSVLQLNPKVCAMQDQELEIEKNTRINSLEHQNWGLINGVWCCISFVLFLVKPSSNTIVTIGDNLYD